MGSIEKTRVTMHLRYIAGLIAIGSLAVVANAAAPTEWVLMGRHGECAPLASLARKGVEFRGLQTPYELIDRMRTAGHQVDVKEYRTTQGLVVEIHVPAKEIAVMIAGADFCKAQRD
jgi:hypothetical protein